MDAGMLPRKFGEEGLLKRTRVVGRWVAITWMDKQQQAGTVEVGRGVSFCAQSALSQWAFRAKFKAIFGFAPQLLGAFALQFL